jgi:hypothetical protein
MMSPASAWQQVQKGAVRCTCGSLVCLSETPSVSLDGMRLNAPGTQHQRPPPQANTMDKHNPSLLWSLQAKQFCRALCEAYPGMEMTVQLLERRPVYVYPHVHGHDCYQHISASGRTMMSSETSYALFRHRRWVHPDYLALDDGEICERVAKRMRVQQRVAERGDDAPAQEKPAAKPMIRDDVSVADSSAGGMPTLTTHVSSDTMLRSKLSRKTAAFNEMINPANSYRQWNQRGHDDYFQQNFNVISCGGLVCQDLPQDRIWRDSRPKYCLRCKMGVAAVPELMRQARAVMGGDCWEDGLKLTFDIVYKGPADPRVNVRVSRGDPVPPLEVEAEAEDAEGPLVEGFGDDEL